MRRQNYFEPKNFIWGQISNLGSYRVKFRNSLKVCKLCIKMTHLTWVFQIKGSRSYQRSPEVIQAGIFEFTKSRGESLSGTFDLSILWKRSSTAMEFLGFQILTLSYGKIVLFTSWCNTKFKELMFIFLHNSAENWSKIA